ncbi:MAG: FtsX-like permease family protein [Mariniblastus sp.]|jgi:ABC-type lipoprotein release transport system permease subunit|nr:FtsX-like permease family protein [Mariniblastus sp.]|tara:strand:- start:1912 stop:3087 length:1176 start_codon:yes stop_codon:yes gene_type:complete
MSPIYLALRELNYRWKSGLVFGLIVAAVTGVLAYFSINDAGFQKEIGRNVRDIGSNVVILPSDVDQYAYHLAGGYSEITMTSNLVSQLIEHRASLNHLIPMLERRAMCATGDHQSIGRVVGISASIAMPDRPKSPMQRSISIGELQLGSELARKLGVARDTKAEVTIAGESFQVQRVNRASGTWQDSAAFIDLKSAQNLFQLPERISRIEAIECTSEQCEASGLQSSVILNNEIAKITDEASFLRKEGMAEARLSVRSVSRENFLILQNVLWVFLALTLLGLAMLNSLGRKPEIGVLQAVGYGRWRVASLFLVRSMLLSAIGAAVGISVGMAASIEQANRLFVMTGQKVSLDWNAAATIGGVAFILAVLGSCVPALLAAGEDPAHLIGKDS